jgi:hypothetical protein
LAIAVDSLLELSGGGLMPPGANMIPKKPMQINENSTLSALPDVKGLIFSRLMFILSTVLCRPVKQLSGSMC